MLLFFLCLEAQLRPPATRGASWGPPPRSPHLGPLRQHHPAPAAAYDSPYAVLCCDPHSFTIRARTRDKIPQLAQALHRHGR